MSLKARWAQLLLATKIGEATANQKLWVKWTVGSWGTVATSIVLVYDKIDYIWLNQSNSIWNNRGKTWQEQW